MAKRSTLVVLVVALAVAVPLQVRAQQNRDTERRNENAPVRTVAEENNTDREERIKERQARLKTRLDAARERVLKNRCKAAQNKLLAVTKRAANVRLSRKHVYDRLTTNLDAFVLRLQNHDLDSDELEAAITQLEAKITAFFAAFDDYEEALKDASEMDCVADPAAFQAALDDARAQRKSLISQAQDIRTFVRESVKDAFTKVRQQLEAKASTTPDSNAEGTN